MASLFQAEEGFKGAEGHINVDFRNHLKGRVHRKHRNANIHNVHIEVRYIHGNRSAAAEIYPAELPGLPADLFFVKSLRTSPMNSALASDVPDLPREPVYFVTTTPRLR